jgi:hypothetical protein
MQFEKGKILFKILGIEKSKNFWVCSKFLPFFLFPFFFLFFLFPFLFFRHLFSPPTCFGV